MLSIWGFLIQTIEVSILAIILLMVKRIFQNKLPPKWQYGIWSILIIGMLFPTGYFGKYILPTMNVFIETIKVVIEKNLHSSYMRTYELIRNFTFFPIIFKKPTSITDILFVIYVIGIVFFIARYIIQYYLLKKIIHKGKQPSQNLQLQVNDICQKYQLKQCRVIVIEQIPSAFIFGIIKPILVVPDQSIDYKIILHELLHYKYKDSMQSVIWSILLCLHWCNPFMHYVHRTIHNDMESLCDQRVLECIEGEERRNYGRILLSMTNNQYPRAFGTSSLSNGGKNIKKRIENIARFKQYPVGMAIVSVCIGIILLSLVVGGRPVNGYIENDSQDTQSFDYELAFSSARMQKCETVASALDLYAKGLLTNNKQYITTTMPQLQQEDYQNVLKTMPSNITSSYLPPFYRVINLEEVNKNTFHAKLMFENIDNETLEDYEYKNNYSLVPVEITKENGWKVKQTGKIIDDHSKTKIILFDETNIQPLFQKKVKSKTGEIELLTYTDSQMLHQDIYDPFNMSGYTYDPYEPQLKAEFNSIQEITAVNYTSTLPLKKGKRLGIEVISIYDKNDKIDYESELNNIDFEGSGVMTGRNCHVSYNTKMIEDLSDNSMKLYDISDKLENEKNPIGYWVRIWVDTQIVETIQIMRE